MIQKVTLCHKWWSVTALLGNCDISVDANTGANYSLVNNTCPGIAEPAGITCKDITSLEP